MVARFIAEQHPDRRRYPIFLLTDQETVVPELPPGVRSLTLFLSSVLCAWLRMRRRPRC